MQAIKLQATVSEDRELILKLPHTVQPGNVEVLVLQSETTSPQIPGNGTTFEEFMASFAKETEINLPDWHILRDSIYD